MPFFSRVAAVVALSSLATFFAAVPVTAETGLSGVVPAHHNNVRSHNNVGKIQAKRANRKKRAGSGKRATCQVKNTTSSVSVPASTAPPTTTPAPSSSAVRTTSSAVATTSAKAIGGGGGFTPGGAKGGLGWNDADRANMGMFIDTGKVSWYVDIKFFPVNIAYILSKVLHLEPLGHRFGQKNRVCAHALG